MLGTCAGTAPSTCRTRLLQASNAGTPSSPTRREHRFDLGGLRGDVVDNSEALIRWGEPVGVVGAAPRSRAGACAREVAGNGHRDGAGRRLAARRHLHGVLSNAQFP